MKCLHFLQNTCTDCNEMSLALAFIYCNSKCKRLLRLLSWMVYSMSLWLPSIYFPHRQYISLFCHFFPAISHQYRPIPTFFLGRPAANPAATQSVREGSQQPAAAFPLHPRLHPHPAAPPVRQAFFSVCHQVLARNQLFAAPPSGRGRGPPDNPSRFSSQ